MLNNNITDKIGFSGGCHWCTEAVFQFLKGVCKVEQGYISTEAEPEKFYEGVIVYYIPEIISMETLIDIHTQTHQSTTNHNLRYKYLSGIYTFNARQLRKAKEILNVINKNKKFDLITGTYHFGAFKHSRTEIQNYYKTDPERPFCKVYIEPKLNLVKHKFSEQFKK